MLVLRTRAAIQKEISNINSSVDMGLLTASQVRRRYEDVSINSMCVDSFNPAYIVKQGELLIGRVFDINKD